MLRLHGAVAKYMSWSGRRREQPIESHLWYGKCWWSDRRLQVGCGTLQRKNLSGSSLRRRESHSRGQLRLWGSIVIWEASRYGSRVLDWISDDVCGGVAATGRCRRAVADKAADALHLYWLPERRSARLQLSQLSLAPYGVGNRMTCVSHVESQAWGLSK